jgi:hypothetical protein
MGLDQYLYAKRYYSDYEHSDPKEREAFARLLEVWGQSVPRGAYGAAGKGFHLTHTIGYWRKANHIHGWFVKNVQNGVDDCGEYYVPRQLLVELIGVCTLLLSSKDEKMAGELLPPVQGFFFGTYEYDDWYWSGVSETVSMLNAALQCEDADFYYSSSW